MSIFGKLEALRIVPVITLHDAAKAGPLAVALVAGGLPCAEVTFRTAAAAAGIRGMVEAHPEILVGAGTILTPAQADQAVEAGAKFIVAPGLNPDVVRHCQQKGVPVLPGSHVAFIALKRAAGAAGRASR